MLKYFQNEIIEISLNMSSIHFDHITSWNRSRKIAIVWSNKHLKNYGTNENNSQNISIIYSYDEAYN